MKLCSTRRGLYWLGAAALLALIAAPWCAGGVICSASAVRWAWLLPMTILPGMVVAVVGWRLGALSAGLTSTAFEARPMDEKTAILQTILDNIPGAVTLFDGRLQMIACNRLAIDLLGFPAEKFVDRLPSMEELARYNALRGEYGEGDPDEIVARFMARAHHPEAHHFERTRPNGVVLDIRGAPLPDGGFVTIYTDITGLKRAQSELERNVLYLQSILDHLPQGVSVFDDQLRLKCWNEVLLDVLGLPTETVYPDVPFEDLIMIPAARGEYGPGEPSEYVAARRALAMQFAPHRFERTRPGGRTHLVEGVPMKSGERTIGFVTTYTDITDRRQIELALERQNAMLNALVDNMPGGVTVFDADLKLVLCNAEVIRLLELPSEFANSKPCLADVVRRNAECGEYGDVDVEATVADMLERARNPVPHRFERVRPNGVAVEVRGAPLPGGGFVTIYIDITERKTVESELRRRNEVFQTLIDNMPGGVTLFDKDFRLVAHNAEYRRLLDFPDELFQDEPALDRFFRYNAQRGEYGPGDADAQVRELLERARKREPHVFERMRPNGTALEIRGLPLLDGGFVTIYTDITEHKAAAAAIERLAHHDALTGLANRHTLEARLDQILADAARCGTRVAIMFIDLDRFKSINDTLGHAVGDGFLVGVAARLVQGTRESDIVARLGGDEFVIVMSDVANPTDLDTVAQKIVAALERPIRVADHELILSASVGVAVFPEDAQDRETLMSHADIAMYYAKSAGRSCFHRFTPEMSEAALARPRLEADMRRALEQGEFLLHYQPHVHAATRHVTGFEALIRWRRADGELIPPSTFIPVAEDCGLIDAIGEWVLREACRTVQSWASERTDTPRLSVNLSARQLKNSLLVGIVRDVLKETGLPPHRLELEVTETAAMENPQLTIDNLRALRALGVSLAIDDFGTGYSSLAYLKLLPITRLKLDRAFVMDIESDPNDAAICAATIGLAHNLGLDVVAEGVETAAQLQYLEQLGCDEIQGYYFSRPLPAAQARCFGDSDLVINCLDEAATWDI